MATARHYPDISALLQAVVEKGEAYNTGSTDGSKSELYLAAVQLANGLQSPFERVAQLSMHGPTLSIAVRIGIELKLFETMSRAEAPKTVAELGILTSSDPKLLRRVLRHLATAQLVIETGPDSYAPNTITRTLADERAQAMFKSTFHGLATASDGIVPYFRTRLGGFVNPSDKRHTLFKHVHQTDLEFFDWVYRPGNEERKAAFQNQMKLRALEPLWFHEVPVAEVLGTAPADCGPDDVLLVDVGGATGHDLQAFHAAFPNMPGRLVLQDLPSTVAALDLAALAPIEPVAHSFFDAQPIRGARGYVLKRVLHDWPDAECRIILEGIKSAMVRGRSRILISDMVLPEVGAAWYETSADLVMMVMFAAYERRESEWRELVASVGLKVVKIWECGVATEKLIVIELP